MPIPRRLIQAAILMAAFLPLSTSATPGFSRSHAQTTPAPANCEISGVVTDAGTGRPLAGAQVVVLDAHTSGGVAGGVSENGPVTLVGSSCDRCDVFGRLRYQALTDAQGRFSIREMVSGPYQVRALARGYAAQYYRVSEKYMLPNAFFLRPGQKRDDIRIALPRQAALTGRVVDENGEPVISAYVQLMRYGPPWARRKSLQPLAAAVTDDRGDYRLFGLAPGRYYIEARYEPGFDLSSWSASEVTKRFLQPTVVSPKTFSLSFYYPGVTEPSEAKPIHVGAGEIRSGLDISVRPLTLAERAKLYPPRFPKPRAGDCQVSGVVTSAATGQPINHAWVFLGPAAGAQQPPHSMASTGAGGHFDFRAVSCWPPLPVLAWKDGFVETYHRAAQIVYAPEMGIPPPRQPKITQVRISLVPAGVVTGKITDAHGKPAACVRVVLIPAYSALPGSWLYPKRETVTDDRGRYRFYQLTAGRYYVAAQIQPSGSVAVQTGASFPVAATPQSGAPFASPYVYYPNADNAGNARQVRVAPGEVVKGTDFSVSPKTTYSISGVVEGPALQALNRGLRIVLAPARGPYGPPLPVHESPLNASGKFEIDGVAPGSYVLWAKAFLGKRQYAAWAPITIRNASVSGIRLEPHTGWTITGHLSVEGRRHENFLYEISARSQEVPPLVGGASPRKVPAGGSFELKNLFPGRYLIQVEAVSAKPVRRFPGPGLPPVPVMRPSNMYIKSARFDGWKIRARLFEVPMQKPTGALDLTVDWNGAEVTGTVLNSRGEPARSAQVVLIPEHHSHLAWWQVKSSVPISRGRFLITAIPPGRYRLFAWENSPEGPLNTDFLDSQWKKGVRIELSEGETKSLNLRVLAIRISPVRGNR